MSQLNLPRKYPKCCTCFSPRPLWNWKRRVRSFYSRSIDLKLNYSITSFPIAILNTVVRPHLINISNSDLGTFEELNKALINATSTHNSLSTNIGQIHMMTIGGFSATTIIIFIIATCFCIKRTKQQLLINTMRGPLQ